MKEHDTTAYCLLASQGTKPFNENLLFEERQNEKRKSYGLSAEGRAFAKGLFETSVDAWNGDNVAKLKEKSLEKLECIGFENKSVSNLVKLSIEARCGVLERAQLVEEIKTSNSPWHETLTLIASKLHANKSKAFVENFTTTWIARVKKKIRQEISLTNSADKSYLQTAVENELATYINSFLQESDQITSERVKQKGLTSLVSETLKERFQEELPFKSYVQESANFHQTKLQKIVEINNNDIENTKSWKNYLQRAKDKVGLSFSSIKARLGSSETKIALARAFLATIALVELGGYYKTEIKNYLSQTLGHLENATWDSFKTSGIQVQRKENDLANQNFTANTYHPTPLPKANLSDNPLGEVADQRGAVQETQNNFLDSLVNTNFRIGPISLESNFTIILPVSTAQLAGYNSSQRFEIQPRAIQERQTPPSVLEDLYQYQKYPNLAEIVRSDTANNNFIFGHSYTYPGGRLPFDWVRTLYLGHQEAIVGNQITLEQDQKGILATTTLEITSVEEIPVSTLNDADYVQTNSNEPLYLDSKTLNLKEEENVVNFVVCSGSLVNGEYTKRVIITAKPLLKLDEEKEQNKPETVVTNQQNNQVESEASKSWPTIQRAFQNNKAFSNPLSQEISIASYSSQEYNHRLEKNMQVASSHINSYFAQNSLSSSNNYLSFIETMNYFEGDEWEVINSVGSGACKIATLIDRAVSNFTDKLGVEPTRINRDSYGHETYDLNLFSVTKIGHDNKGSIEPDDEVLISYWGPNTPANSDYEIKLNQELSNGYPIPSDLELKIALSQDEHGNFQAQILSNYSISYLRELIQKQSVDNLYNAENNSSYN